MDIWSIIEKKYQYFMCSNNQLIMPFMNFWYFQPYSFQSVGSINNTFNTSCIEMMQENDTLAIQQFKVIFK